MMGIIGFCIGRCTIEPEIKTKVKYVHRPTIHDSIPAPVPYEVKIPSSPEYKYKYIDSSKTVIDTSAIINDWITSKSYQSILIDNDTIGKLKLNAEVQYNGLRKLDYEFTPIQVVTTTVTSNKKKLEFLGGAGLSTNGIVNFQLGIITKNHLGFSYQFNIDPSNGKNYHGLNVLLKY